MRISVYQLEHKAISTCSQLLAYFGIDFAVLYGFYVDVQIPKCLKQLKIAAGYQLSASHSAWLILPIEYYYRSICSWQDWLWGPANAICTHGGVSS